MASAKKQKDAGERNIGERLHVQGFTLVELLVVIAIIALLASLLLPGLAAAKDRAKSAACKNNLRQLGIALNLYVTDYEKYPGNAAMYARNGLFGEPVFQGIWAAGMNWLNPYLGGHYDLNSSASQFYASDSPRVFNCPGRHAQRIPGLFGNPGTEVRWLGYGYNELGTGWPNRTLSLGLGFTVEVTGFETGSTQPLGPRTYVSPANVTSPSVMIAIADSGATGWLTPKFPTDGESTLRGPHSKGEAANVLFCDGHVDFGTHKKWNAPSDEAMARWNNDNLPHPETWR